MICTPSKNFEAIHRPSDIRVAAFASNRPTSSQNNDRAEQGNCNQRPDFTQNIRRHHQIPTFSNTKGATHRPRLHDFYSLLPEYQSQLGKPAKFSDLFSDGFQRLKLDRWIFAY
jgi:hypothetical protein